MLNSLLVIVIARRILWGLDWHPANGLDGLKGRNYTVD